MDPYNDEQVRAVWQRVTAATEVTGSSYAAGADPAVLLDFISGEQQDSRVYQALACKLGGSDGVQLRRMAKEKACRAKRLAAAYFLLTGVRPCVRTLPFAAVTCPVEELRSRYEAELRDAEGYCTVSHRFSGQTALMLEELAKGSLQYSQTVLCILENQI